MSAAEKVMETSGTKSDLTECIAFISDNQTQSVVASVLDEQFENGSVRDGSTSEVIEYLSRSDPPEILIVDISDSASPLTAMMSLTAAMTDDTRIIGIGSVNDVSLYREIIDAGATDYLVKPVTEKALQAALRRSNEPTHTTAPEAQDSKRGRVAVIGTRGGVGASTTAVNLAWLMAEEEKTPTMLMDLDLEFGTIALALDLEPTRGLREALENPSRIDSLFLSSATAKLTERLSVMATEETLRSDLNFNPNAIDMLFEALSRTHDNIVIDLPRHNFLIRQRVLEAATKIVIVTELSLSGLRDAIRLVAEIEDIAKDTAITVVANRTGGPKQAMTVAEFQKALGRKVDLQVPDDTKAVNLAANTGKPLVQSDKRSKASKAFRDIKHWIVQGEKKENKDAGKAKGGLFKRKK